MMWWLIGIAALSALAFRSLPIFLKNSRLLTEQNSRLHRFFALSSQSMLGVFAYASLFNSASLDDLLGGVSMTSHTGLAVICLGFLAVLFGAKLTPTYIVALTLFIGIELLVSST